MGELDLKGNFMTNLMEDAQDILLDLEGELQKYSELMSQIRSDNPGFDQVSEENISKTQATRWLHGATDLQECNEIEKWIFDKPPLTDLAKESASKCIWYWKEWLEQSNKYYGDFDEFEIEEPLKDEMLFSYGYNGVPCENLTKGVLIRPVSVDNGLILICPKCTYLARSILWIVNSCFMRAAKDPFYPSD